MNEEHPHPGGRGFEKTSEPPTIGEIMHQRIQAVLQSNAVSSEKPDLHQLKVEINNLLFMFLPNRMTLGEMEAIAVGIFDVVLEEWEKPR